jgi:hypothetical protein
VLKTPPARALATLPPTLIVEEEPVVVRDPAPVAALSAPLVERPDNRALATDAPASAASDAVRSTLERYRAAFSALDSSAAAAVWPRANVRNLSRAFEQLVSQQIVFATCTVDVTDTSATANCTGAATYVPRVGNRTPRTDDRHWQCALQRVQDQWVIDTVTVR